MGITDEGERLNTVNSILRVLEILECFTAIKTTWSLTDLADELKLPITTVHRQLKTLVSAGYIAQDSSHKTYTVGSKLILMSCQMLSKYDFRNIARPYLECLMQSAQETIHLCQLDGNEMFYVDKIESTTQSVNCNSRIGKKIPAHSAAAGKVLLSMKGQAFIEKYCESLSDYPVFTENTITSPSVLKDELSKIKAQGYAIDNEEAELGLVCVAMPVYDANQCIAAVSISGPGFRMHDQIKNLIPLLKKQTEEISYMLGHQ